MKKNYLRQCVRLIDKKKMTMLTKCLYGEYKKTQNDFGF